MKAINYKCLKHLEKATKVLKRMETISSKLQEINSPLALDEQN